MLGQEKADQKGKGTWALKEDTGRLVETCEWKGEKDAGLSPHNG